MEPLIVVIVILAAWDVAKTAVRKQLVDFRASAGKAGKASAGKTAPARRGALRRHAIGYWAREALHGFPVARTGWHAGWLAHHKARDEQRAIRENARTEHLETRASFLTGLKDHRKRQAQAQAEIDKALAASPEPVKGRKAVRGAAANVLPFRRRSADDQAEGTPAEGDGTGQAEGAQKTRRVDGKPETEADKRFFAERESGYTGPLDQDGRRPDMSDPEARRDAGILNALQNGGGRHARPQDQQQSQPQQEEGNRMASDVTFREVLASAQRAAGQAEHDSVSIAARRKAAEQDADQMQAANVDPAVISEQMSHADALAEAEKALARAGECAASTLNLVQRYHGQMQEAHDDAPGKVAERGFHES